MPMRGLSRNGQSQSDRVSTKDMRKPDSFYYACVTHVPLWLEFPSFVVPIYLGESQRDGKLNSRDLAPEWELHHPKLGGTVGTFALKNYIQKNCPNVTKVGICSYRRFISRTVIGKDQKINLRTMFGKPTSSRWFGKPTSSKCFISKADLLTFDLPTLMLPDNSAFLISCTKVPGYLRQYSHAHCAEDLLRFAAEAVEQGVLARSDIPLFFDEKIFFVGGLDLGVFPAEFWIRAVSAIEAVILCCIKRSPVRREGYQARALSFCAERLGSYILMRHLQSNYEFSTVTKNFIGHLIQVTE
jgi:hypothetical protein